MSHTFFSANKSSINNLFKTSRHLSIFPLSLSNAIYAIIKLWFSEFCDQIISFSLRTAFVFSRFLIGHEPGCAYVFLVFRIYWSISFIFSSITLIYYSLSSISFSLPFICFCFRVGYRKTHVMKNKKNILLTSILRGPINGLTLTYFVYFANAIWYIFFDAKKAITGILIGHTIFN